ncbi:hypothetical protein J2S54_000975 [Streptomyces sp. DSM 42143]|uniref:hypothetical protein n=1 Tax=Streptomyces sp. DSM 42143 TaxID=2817711 RepID=UPI00278506A4|nr:hypothetical protein [Streptomyces sp. DSM 42143]MDQ0384155.1 hypothetical protein [Streptomyces sp. DSM 42143]
MSPTSAQHEAESLLHALDPLDHPRRMRELVVRARELNTPRPVLVELERHGAYGRGLAVVAASATGDAGWIADRIADTDPYVRGHALRVADSLRIPDAAFEAALADAPEAARRDLLRAVVAGRRTALADRLVDGLRRDRGDAEAARLLPGCSAPVVARLLPGLLHAVLAWRTLAERHRTALLDVLEGELTALPEALHDTWWHRYAQAMATLAPLAPGRVLGLLDRQGPSRLPAGLRVHLPAFAAADPQRVLRLLPTPAWNSVVGVHRLGRTALYRLTRTHSPELVAYGRTLMPYGGLPRLLKALPPARRHALYTAVREGRGTGAVVVDAQLLEVLPRRHAAQEARETAARARETGAYAVTVLTAESFLPVAEVRDGLLAATARPDAEDRARVWPMLIGNAARSGDPAAVTAALRDMARLRNEQDPVRSAALRALAGTRAALFTEESVPHLERVAADAVEARDCSGETRRPLTDLALAVLGEHAAGGPGALVDWSLRTLVRLAESAGRVDLGRLDRTLRRGQEHLVFEALRPWLDARAGKGDHRPVLALAESVGRRAEGMSALQEMLWRAFRDGDVTAASSALLEWLKPVRTRDERVARVLAHDPSAADLPVVWSLLVRRRTDLLGVLLADTPPHGRFLPEGRQPTMWVEAADARRWVPRQRALLLRRLSARAADTSLPHCERAEAVTEAAGVPDGGADVARRWTASPDVEIAEAALAALARTDRAAEALPELLAHAGGDRARVAVYAAARASRHAPPSRLAAQLKDVLRAPDAKVTSQKEAVRIAAARLPVPEAAVLVTEVYAGQGTHPDVRAACVAAAGGLLGHEEVWELLHDAAGGAPVLRAALLRVSPLDLPETHRARYARLVRGVAATDDPATAGSALRALARWTPWSAEAPGVLAAAVTDLTNRETWRSAASALIEAASGAPHGLAALLDTLRTLAGSTADEDDDAGERRDRPARQRVVLLAEQLGRSGLGSEAARRPVALAAAELLGANDAYAAQAAVLAAECVDLAAVPPRLDQVTALAGPGRPALAARVADTVRGRLESREQPGEAEALRVEAAALASHGGHAEGLMAVAVTGALGSREDWPEPWRERLRALRRHPVPDVRDAALEETTAYE